MVVIRLYILRITYQLNKQYIMKDSHCRIFYNCLLKKQYVLDSLYLGSSSFISHEISHVLLQCVIVCRHQTES